MKKPIAKVSECWYSLRVLHSPCADSHHRYGGRICAVQTLILSSKGKSRDDTCKLVGGMTRGCRKCIPSGTALRSHRRSRAKPPLRSSHCSVSNNSKGSSTATRGTSGNKNNSRVNCDGIATFKRTGGTKSREKTLRGASSFRRAHTGR